jgi:succinyl-CoA synthetase beta subunit
MKIHEYQAKEIFRRFGLPVPNGKLAKTADEAYDIAKWLAATPVVVKAQIHAGGRGKGGGVKLARSADEARDRAKDMLGMMLKDQADSAEGGKRSRRFTSRRDSKIARELYFAITLDRDTSRVTLMGSAEGGVDIEEVAAKTPEKIYRTTIDPLLGLRSHHARKLGVSLGFSGKTLNEAIKVMQGLYRVFVETDASLVEVNPLIVTQDGGVVCLDGKMTFDENALYRHADITAMRDLDEEDMKEIEAKSTTSLTSRSTATSAVWSTAQASPWRRWTSSNTPVAARRTSSTSAAAPRPRR